MLAVTAIDFPVFPSVSSAAIQTAENNAVHGKGFRRPRTPPTGRLAPRPGRRTRGANARSPTTPATPAPPGYRVTYFDATTPGSGRVGSRDITAAGDGTFWFCGQRNGTLNRLDPRTGAIRTVDLPLIQIVGLTYCIMVLLISLVVDVLYLVLNPKLRSR